MSTQNRIFDDLSRLMTNAMGVAQGAKDEAEAAINGRIDRWLADRDFVTREDFEAVREMAIKARSENAELRARIEALEGGNPNQGMTPMEKMKPMEPMEPMKPMKPMQGGQSQSQSGGGDQSQSQSQTGVDGETKWQDQKNGPDGHQRSSGHDGQTQDQS